MPTRFAAPPSEPDQSPPDSPLSVLSSAGEEHDAEDDEDSRWVDLPRPSKRQKTNDGTAAPASPTVVVPEEEPEPEPLEGMSDVSEDTDGDIPSSPANARLDDEDFQEQVASCAWEGCEAGDLGNMDKLVEHIHNDHIESRQKKYTCEWNGCTRKSMAHASGYALKAHMRSHTREKPFYCYLPECDRAFTRSDALAKHMRTVHETEALRPSDPVPKSMQTGVSGAKSGKLKIIIKTPQSHAAGQEDSVDDGASMDELDKDLFTPMTEDMFTRDELDLRIDDLYQLCRFQVKWSEKEGEKLRKEIKDLEEAYNQLWSEKESMLAQVIDSEVAWQGRRNAILSGEVDVQTSGVLDSKDGGSTNGVQHDHENDDEVQLVELEPEQEPDPDTTSRRHSQVRVQS